MNAQQFEQAAKTGLIFFDADMQPVTPKVGDWFCEFDTRESDDDIEDCDLVEYLGESDSHTFNDKGQLVTRRIHQVTPDECETIREPATFVLIRQNY